MNDKVKKLLLPIIIILILIVVFLFIFFNKKEHTVSFMTEDGIVIENLKVMKNGLLEMPEGPKKEGFVFLYWTLNGKRFDSLTKITGDMVLKPFYQQIGEDVPVVKEYNITFDTDGGNQIGNQMVKENEKIVKPENPTKKDYKFIHWMLEENEYDFETLVVSDMVLKAKWEKEKKETAKTPSPSQSTPKPTPKPTPTPTPTPTPPKEPIYTAVYVEYMLGSPQKVVSVFKDGKAVSANAILSDNGTILGEYNSDANKILIDKSELTFATKIRLSDGSIVKITK